ncbi:helix-turn-helix domain-containing protein [Bacteroidota bacterium]
MNHPAEKQYIDKLTAIVEENFSNPSFGVAELAKEMGISHSGLHRKLKAIARLSISQFIREARLKRAMELLQHQDDTVSEIAYEVGFGSTTYFSKCFHDYYGYPPGEVRKRYISGPDSGDNLRGFEKPQKQVNSIAVLPFDNYTGDENQAFLVAGLHDTLISELGQLTNLRVISKTSVMQYANSKKAIKEIAAELNVDTIFEASVLLVDENIRVQLKLFTVHPDEQLLWAQTFDADLGNILKLYSQIIRKIANEIQLTLSPELKTQLAKTREVNPESYKAYLRGMYNLYQLTEEGMKKGLEYLHEAVRIDPAEPFAHAGLALGYLDIAHGPLNPGDAYIKAESAAFQAFKLDPNMAEAQLALAELCIYATWKFDEGEKYFLRTNELNPNISLSHYHYAWLLFLFGRKEEAIIEHKLAQKCDPFNPMITAFTGALYSYVGWYDDAIREAKKSFEIQKDCPDGYFVLGETYLAMGQNDKAIQMHQKLREVAPVWTWVLGYTYALTGHSNEAKKILSELENAEITSWTAMGIAVINGALGNMDEAFRWIAYKPHHAWIAWIAVMPMWKPLYADVRHAEFVKSLHLPSR